MAGLEGGGRAPARRVAGAGWAARGPRGGIGPGWAGGVFSPGAPAPSELGAAAPWCDELGEQGGRGGRGDLLSPRDCCGTLAA